MADQINLNEATATLREVTVAIFDVDSDPVTGIDESDVTIKIAKAGATSMSASTATLTELNAASEGGLFALRFPAGEVDTLGDLRLEISSGTTVIETVRGYVTIVTPVWSTVLDSSAPVNAQKAGEILNIVISAVVADCDNVSADGTVNIRNTGDTKNRIEGVIAGPVRGLTSLDGT